MSIDFKFSKASIDAPKPKYEGHETVPDDSHKGGVVTAIGLAASWLFIVGGGLACVHAFGPRDADGNLPQGSYRVPFEPKETKISDYDID